MCRTQERVNAWHVHHMTRSTFRTLRLPYALKQSTYLGHRAQLRNWIRLATRFVAWQEPRHMERFVRIQCLYRCWRRWHVFMRDRDQFETPGLAMKIAQRRKRVVAFQAYLVRQNILNLESPRAQLACCHTRQAIFARWVEYTQLYRVLHQMLAAFRTRYVHCEQRPISIYRSISIYIYRYVSPSGSMVTATYVVCIHAWFGATLDGIERRSQNESRKSIHREYRLVHARSC
jgi:hypothetical protein